MTLSNPSITLSTYSCRLIPTSNWAIKLNPNTIWFAWCGELVCAMRSSSLCPKIIYSHSPITNEIYLVKSKLFIFVCNVHMQMNTEKKIDLIRNIKWIINNKLIDNWEQTNTNTKEKKYFEMNSFLFFFFINSSLSSLFVSFCWMGRVSLNTNNFKENRRRNDGHLDEYTQQHLSVPPIKYADTNSE